MNCALCHKIIRFEDRVFWRYNEPYHERCLPKQLAFERKQEREKEQTRLERWNFLDSA